MRFSALMIPFFLFYFSCKTIVDSATAKSSNVDKTVADFYIQFNSVCCGPTSYTPWLSYTQEFLFQNNLQFYLIEKASGLGREGEYMFLLFTSDWTENQRQKYFSGLQKITWENQNESSFGGVQVGTNFPVKKLQNFPMLKIEEIQLSDL